MDILRESSVARRKSALPVRIVSFVLLAVGGVLTSACPSSGYRVYIAGEYSATDVSAFVVAPREPLGGEWAVSRPLKIRSSEYGVAFQAKPPKDRWGAPQSLAHIVNYDDGFTEWLETFLNELPLVLKQDLLNLAVEDEREKHSRTGQHYAVALIALAVNLARWMSASDLPDSARRASQEWQNIAMTIWYNEVVWLLCVRNGTIECFAVSARARFYLPSQYRSGLPESSLPLKSGISDRQVREYLVPLQRLRSIAVWERMLHVVFRDTAEAQLDPKLLEALDIWHLHPVPGAAMCEAVAEAGD